MFHLNVHQWETSAEEGLNNQVHETIPCEDTSRPLSLTLFSLPDGLPNKVATVVGTEAVRGLGNTDFRSPRPVLLQPPLSASSRDQC